MIPHTAGHPENWPSPSTRGAVPFITAHSRLAFCPKPASSTRIPGCKICSIPGKARQSRFGGQSRTHLLVDSGRCRQNRFEGNLVDGLATGNHRSGKSPSLVEGSKCSHQPAAPFGTLCFYGQYQPNFPDVKFHRLPEDPSFSAALAVLRLRSSSGRLWLISAGTGKMPLRKIWLMKGRKKGRRRPEPPIRCEPISSARPPSSPDT